MSFWRRTTTAIAGLAAGTLLVSACDFDGAYDLPLPGSPVSADNAYEVTAEFEDILNVVPRSPVMVDDVTIGEVTEVDRVGWHARVTLRIREDVDLPDNAVAEIRQVSLLGEKYVSLEAPQQGASLTRLGEGDQIPLTRTGRNPEVEEVLGALSALLSGGGVAQLGTITEELNNVMSGRTDRLRGLLDSLDSVVGNLDAQKGDIINALESLNNLTKTLNSERRTITDALDVAGPAVKVLGDQEKELVAMLRSLDRLGVVGTRVINASQKNLIASLRDLKPIVSNLADAGDELAPGLNLLVSFPFPKEASEIVQGDYANTSIKADISLENFIPKNGLQGLLDNLGLGDLPNLPGLPDLPNLPNLPDLPKLPDLPGLPVVNKCLKSGKIASGSCLKVLGSLQQVATLTQRCKTRPRNTVCRAMNALGGRGNGGKGGRGGGRNPLGLPNLNLPGLSRMTAAIASGTPETGLDDESLFGGAR